MQDFTGLRKGRLLVLERGPSDGKTRKYKVECDCGTIFWISDASLRNNGNSCGCLRKELNTKHGEKYTLLYKKWGNMKTRCYNKKDNSYHNYGGRGIKVYKPWIKSYIKFRDYIVKTIGYPGKKDTLDRIKVNEDYKPGNIRWLTTKENCNNKRHNVKYNYKNKFLTASQIYDITKPVISRDTFRNRLREGWVIKDAVTLPISKKKYKNRKPLPRFYFHPKRVRQRRRERARLTRDTVHTIKVR